jgi:hypothetical protein
VRGIFSDASDDDELDDARSRDKGSGRFFWLNAGQMDQYHS